MSEGWANLNSAEQGNAGFSVPTKLTLGFASLIVLATLSVLLIWMQLGPVNTALVRTETVRVPTATVTVNARAALLQMTSNIRAYLSLGEPRFLDQFHKSHQEFLDQLNQLEKLLAASDDPEAHQSMQDLKADFADWDELPQKMFDMHDNPLENQQSLFTLRESGEPLVDESLRLITAMIEEQANRPISSENTQLLKHMADFRSSFSELASGIRGYVGTLDPLFKTKYLKSLKLNNLHWELLVSRGKVMSLKQDNALSRLTESRSGFLTLPEEWIFPAAESDESHKDLYMLRNSAIPLADRMDARLRDLVNDQNGRLKTDVQSSRSNLQRLWWETVAVGLLTVVIGAALAFCFRKTIIQDMDLRHSAEETARVAQQRLFEIEHAAHEQVQIELETVQGELVKSTRLATLGQLTATVSHEIRNPLGTIRTSVFSIAEEVRGNNSRVDRALDRAERNILRCDDIIEELFDFTRIKKPQLVPTEIDTWLAELLDEQDIPSQIAVSRQLDSKVTIEVDQEHLRRCIVNLVTNACQAISESKKDEARLTIQTTIENKTLLICIVDTGIGIESALMDKIFEPLFTTKGFGVGLGLPVVDQFVRQLGGGISLQSDLGQGTTAKLWLPLDMPSGAIM